MVTLMQIQELKASRQQCLQECYKKHDAALALFNTLLVFQAYEVQVLTEEELSWTDGIHKARNNMQALKNTYMDIQRAHQQHEQTEHGVVNQVTTFLWQGVARNKDVIPELMMPGNKLENELKGWDQANDAFKTADRRYRCALTAHPVWGLPAEQRPKSNARKAVPR